LKDTVTDRRVFHIGVLNLRASQHQRAGDATRTMIDRNGHERRLGFEDGRLAWVREPDGSLTHYCYDRPGRLVSRTDALGATSHYAYDSAGRLEIVTHPDGATLRFAYDGRGRLVRRVLPNRVTTSLAYDGDLLTRVAFSPEDAVTITYDAAGRLQTVEEQGCVTRYSYDAWGRLDVVTRIIDDVPFTLRCGAEGQSASLRLPNGGILDFEDPWSGRGGQDVGCDVRFDRAANVVASSEGEFVYDACDQLVEARHPAHGHTHYEYDAVGNRKARRASDGETLYSHDTCNRLIRVSRPDGSSVRLEYDAQGNLIRKTAGDTAWRYAYNGRQQLASVRRNGRVVARYRYDLWGRRIWRRAGGETTLYHYDPAGRLIAMTRPDGRLVSAFRYERGRTVVLRQNRTLSLHTDHLGSTQRITDEAGRVVWQADYSPFGRLRNTAPGFECPLFTGRMWDAESGLYYCGARYYDPGLGRFTMPDPWTGGPDDVRLVGGMGGAPVLPQSWLTRPRLANRYPYCLNNPATYRDPEGLGVLGTIGKTILAIIWSSPWTLLGASLTLLNWLFQFPLFGFAYLPDYGIDGVSSGRLGSAAMINIGGIGPSPLALANIHFARRGFVDDLDDTAQEYVIPVEAHRKPRQLRTARTAYFEHLLSHTVQANFSGPFWPFVYLFASDGLEKDAARDSGFTRIAEPTLTLAPDEIHTSVGNDLIVVGGQKPYTARVDAAAGAVGAFADLPRFSEAHFTPQYRPGKYTITVEDDAGITDSRDFEISTLRVKDVDVVRPANIFVDKISDPDIPTVRLVDPGGPTRASVTVKFDVEPDEGEMFFEVVNPNPANPPPLVLSQTSSIGDTEVTITLQNAPAGVPPEDYMINVRAWNQSGPVLKQLRVRSMTPQNVVLQIHIVRKDNGTDPSFTRAEVDKMIARANTIWAQAGITLTARAATRFIDETLSQVIDVTCVPPGGLTSTEEARMYRWRPTPPGPFVAPQDTNNQDPNVINCYFIDDLNPDNCAVAYAGLSSNRMVVTKSATATTLAHEFGHCLGLGHPGEENPKPRELGERLMTSGETNRSEPYLVSNQSNPARAGNGADETASARTQAATRLGP
jgi:RHS repeat-associated protein